MFPPSIQVWGPPGRLPQPDAEPAQPPPGRLRGGAGAVRPGAGPGAGGRAAAVGAAAPGQDHRPRGRRGRPGHHLQGLLCRQVRGAAGLRGDVPLAAVTPALRTAGGGSDSSMLGLNRGAFSGSGVLPLSPVPWDSASRCFPGGGSASRATEMEKATGRGPISWPGGQTRSCSVWKGKSSPQDIPLCPGRGDMRLSIPAGPSRHPQCPPQPWGCTIEGFGVPPRAQPQLGEL